MDVQLGLVASLVRQTTYSVQRRAPAPASLQAGEPDDRAQEMRKAVGTLQQANRGSRQTAKINARQRLDRIKKELRLLRQFGGDPKAAARQLARLARELAAAVKAYAAASGSDADKVVGDVTAIAESNSEPGAQTVWEEPFVANQGDVAADCATPPADGRKAEDGPAVPACRDESKRLSDERSGSEREADQRFVAEARGLVKQIRALIKSARPRLGDGERELNDADMAAEGAARALHQAVPPALHVSLTV